MIRIAPLLGLNKDAVQTYWQQLYMSGRLETRMCMVKDPRWEDVLELIRNKGQQIYHILDDLDIVGEFMLDNFMGRSAQGHFSMHPDLPHKRAIEIGSMVADQILQWPSSNSTGPIFKSIYGITPVTNRAACIWVQKIKFKKIGILPGGIVDRGKVVDGMISIRTAATSQIYRGSTES